MAFDWDAELERLNSAELDTFGVSCTYTPKGGSPFQIALIEKTPKEWEPVRPGVNAIRWAKASDFSLPPANGDSVLVGEQLYTVVDLRADAGAGLKLYLKEQKS
jgi:hypothetical protein